MGDCERIALRHGAIASLALIDLSLDQQWPLEAFQASSRSTDLDGEYYAGRLRDGANSVRRMSDNQEVARLESAEPIQRNTIVQFSPDRRFIAARSQTRNDIALNVWRIDDANLICVNRLSKSPINDTFDFSSDSSRIAIVHPDGSVGLLSGQDFEVSRKLTNETPARAVRFDPSGSRLAVMRATQTDVLDIDSGEIL